MPTTTKELKTQSGVVLTEVTLTNAGGVPMATGYTVSSKRTQEVRSSHTLPTAERHFAEELARCETPRPAK